MIEENSVVDSFFGEVAKNPKALSPKDKLEAMTRLKDEAFAFSELLTNFQVVYEWVHVSKVFLSTQKELDQSYIWSQGYLVSMVRKDNNSKYMYKAFSGLKGDELLDEMQESVKEVVSESIKLLEAEPIVPGEYDIICSPDVTGLIVHEAFGHGVEMDMFVKERAKAVEYMGRPVASAHVTMHDGAASDYHVSSYLFDDEGTLGSDTKIIDKGVLVSGISDLLSALKLGTKPTGNGKRESFERKAYARMTNTFFTGGSDKLEDMISSIESGYLLDYSMSGMEDPKNWGIQCVYILGREIKNGKLTGKLVSPVIMTGYVPDVLSAITMVSPEVELGGSGACGKGYKELCKVSSGGPYIKTRARLG